MAVNIGVLSIKGGVGKTTATANLGTALAELGQKVLIVDANFTAPNLGIHFGILNPKTSLKDVLHDKKPLFDAIVSHKKNLDVLPMTSLNEKIKPNKLQQKLKYAQKLYDYILIDSSPNLNEEMQATMLASDKLFVVSTPDYPTLYCTLHAIQRAKEKKVPITGLILNRTRNKSWELSINDMEDATQVPVLAIIPDEIKVLEALANTNPVVEYTPSIEASVEYKKLASAIVGVEYKDKRLKSIMKKLISESKHEANRRALWKH